MQIRPERRSQDQPLVIRRAAATDPALSVTALGILTRVLASPGGALSVEDLDAGDTPGAVRAGLEQLRRAGYLVIDLDEVYRVSDTPQVPPGTMIATATVSHAQRPSLMPVPDLDHEHPPSSPQDLHPAPRRADGLERAPDPDESRRAAQRGAARVRDALTRTLEKNETRQHAARERREAARQVRVEAEHAARAEALAQVRAQADAQTASTDPEGSEA